MQYLQIDVEVADALTYMVQNYYQGAGIVQESLDRLQQAFRCCGMFFLCLKHETSVIIGVCKRIGLYKLRLSTEGTETL